jgi:hypothetical protein
MIERFGHFYLRRANVRGQHFAKRAGKEAATLAVSAPHIQTQLQVSLILCNTNYSIFKNVVLSCFCSVFLNTFSFKKLTILSASPGGALGRDFA